MKILPRTHFGNPILRAKAKTVPAAYLKTPAFKALVRQMFRTMRSAKGVGLAAPQINRSIRLAVIAVPAVRFRRVLVNPRIVWRSKASRLDWEGCLSLVGIRGQVPRSAAIKVEYADENGKRVRESCSGYIARIFQHEIDHLNGFVYVDRMADMRTLMTQKEFIKRIAR